MIRLLAKSTIWTWLLIILNNTGKKKPEKMNWTTCATRLLSGWLRPCFWNALKAVFMHSASALIVNSVFSRHTLRNLSRAGFLTAASTENCWPLRRMIPKESRLLSALFRLLIWRTTTSNVSKRISKRTCRGWNGSILRLNRLAWKKTTNLNSLFVY